MTKRNFTFVLGALIFVLVSILFFMDGWRVSKSHSTLVRLENATLLAENGSQNVNLPHKLSRAEFRPNGSLVYFTLALELAKTPKNPLAIYVAKLSLSGNVYLNGTLTGSCGFLPLDELRCLHQPQIYVPQPDLWRVGTNTLVFEVFANGQQMNGISAVVVGPIEQVYSELYRKAKFFKVFLLRALAWISLFVGLSSLIVVAYLRDQTVFLWFGLASLCNAAAMLNFLIVHWHWDQEVVSRLIFLARLLSIPLILLTFLSLITSSRYDHRVVTFLKSYLVVAIAVIGVLSESRITVIGLYLLIIPAHFYVVFTSIMSATRYRTLLNISVASLMPVLTIAGFSDFFRLSGHADLEGVYWLGYAYASIALIGGALVVGQLAQALKVSRRFQQELENTVQNKTRDLQEALSNISNLEVSALQLTENLKIGTFTLRYVDRGDCALVFTSSYFLTLLRIPGNTGHVSFDQFLSQLNDQHRETFQDTLLDASKKMGFFRWEGLLEFSDDRKWLSIEGHPRRQGSNNLLWDCICVDTTGARDAEERVKKAHLELVETAVRKSRDEERARLLRDLHDGIGSQLSSARIALKFGHYQTADIEQILDECLADLQILVDTLDNEVVTLQDALADLKYRTERRLSGLSVTIVWEIDLPSEEDYEWSIAPHVVVQTLRIIQEALTNAIRHADAKNITIGARNRHRMVEFWVEDDGVGLGNMKSIGHGLANIEKRCKQINARLTVIDRSPGLKLAFEVAVDDK